MLRHLVFYTLTSTLLLALCNGLSRRDKCTAVTSAYTDMGFPAIDVPHTAQKGKRRQMCYTKVTCCTDEMEENFKPHSRLQLGRLIANKTEFTRTSFITATAQFNEFFLSLLKTGQSELDFMFNSAYGLMYKQNEDVFKQLFANFQRYYKGGSIGLNEVMNTFFTDVFTRMFVMQSPQYKYSEQYLSCIASKMESLQPFGTIPATVTKKVRQAFVAARTFVQGLAVGRNVALKMAQVQLTDSCTEAYTKSSLCQTCSGLSSLRPCKDYCVNVMKGCLAYHSEISSSWTEYIEAMDELAERLEGSGSFNIEIVITPLKDMISEAIMKYHDNSKPVRDKMFSNEMCGQPPPAHARDKRGARSRKRQRGKKKLSTEQQGALHTLVRNIRLKIMRVKTVWTELPNSLCEGTSAGASQCWNGEELGRYSKNVVGNDLLDNIRNPEVNVPSGGDNHIVTEQIAELKKAANHLSNAKLGIDVDWLDFDASKSLNAPAQTVPTVKMTTTTTTTTSSTTTTSGTTRTSRQTTSIRTTTTTTTGSPIEVMEGSGGSGSETSTEPHDNTNLDSEDGDVDDGYVDIGSGYNSVKIAPFSKPQGGGRKNKKDKDKSNQGGGVEDGSGTLYDPDGPVLVPIHSSNTLYKPDSRNFGTDYGQINRNPDVYTVEGSGNGPLLHNTNINPDDEDYYASRERGSNSAPAESNAIEAGATQKKLNLDLSTPRSGATIDIHSNLTLFVGFIISILFVHGVGVS